MKAFLVMFPKKEVNPYPQMQSWPSTYPDNRPILVIADGISDVADRNKSAIEIKEIDVQYVIVHGKSDGVVKKE